MFRLEREVGFPYFDPTRLHAVEAQLDRSELGYELKDPRYSRGRVGEFKLVVAETVVLASDILRVPGVDLGVGNGIISDGRTYIALAEMNQDGEGHVVFSRDYLFAHLANDPSDLSPTHQNLKSDHPAEITAHEMKHILQLIEEPSRVEADCLYAAGNDQRWRETDSEKSARGFAKEYMDKLSSLSFGRHKHFKFFMHKI